MSLDLTAALVVFLAVAIWRFARRPRRTRSSHTFPDVGTAPPSAHPVTVWRYNDDGLGMYSHDLPTTSQQVDEATSGRERGD